jgi:hypothetical protein
LRDLRWLCRLAGWACAAAIIVLSLVPGEVRPQSGVWSGQVEHLLAYSIAAALLAIGYPGRSHLVCALMIGLAGVLETLQLWIPGRNAELYGFVASAAGVALGSAGAAVGDRAVVLRREG